MSGPHSPTGGVQPFPIGGRLVRERERLAGMTAEERAFRKQYLKDQELSKNEPRFVPEYWKERTNPIRRFYQFPLNTVENIIKPVIVSSFCFGESADDVTITNVLGTESGPANPLLDRQVLDGWLRSPRRLLLLQIQRQRKSPTNCLDLVKIHLEISVFVGLDKSKGLESHPLEKAVRARRRGLSKAQRQIKPI
jgi:hypothetical protein